MEEDIWEGRGFGFRTFVPPRLREGFVGGVGLRVRIHLLGGSSAKRLSLLCWSRLLLVDLSFSYHFVVGQSRRTTRLPGLRMLPSSLVQIFHTVLFVECVRGVEPFLL